MRQIALCAALGSQVVSEVTSAARNIPEGNNAFEIVARGIDGFIFMCFEQQTFPAAINVKVSLEAYVIQAGWHSEADMLRVWAEVNGTSDVTLLPGCEDTGNKHNIDTMPMRRSATGKPYIGPESDPGDPALLPDLWNWTVLTADLGAVSSFRVCAGLETGAGAEAMCVGILARTAHIPGAFW